MNKVQCTKSLLAIMFLMIGIQLSAQNKWLDQIGEIHSALPKTKLLNADECLFELNEMAQIGDEVIGRVNLANNSYEEADFSIVGGNGATYFTIDKFVNSRGKHFGILILNRILPNNQDYLVSVRASFKNGVSDEQTYTIKIVKETIAEKIYRFAYDNLAGNGRLYFKASDDELEEYYSKFNLDGTFSDLTYGLSKDGWEGLNEGAERINKLAMAFLNENSVFYKNEALKDKVYTALIFNSKEFAKYRTHWFETHLWRNTDYIAGVGLNYFELLREEMKSNNVEVSAKATEVYDAILDNCDNLFAERMYERPAIGNANRNHRMRSIVVRVAISYDYNRSITDEDVWFDKEDPRIPGFYPNGAIHDLVELIETSFVTADTYQDMNGFFPDGTICHHPSAGIQFTADGYGWPWLTEWSIPLADLLKNTPFQLKNDTYDKVAERILDAYRPLTYNGYLDMAVGGLLPDREKWGGRLLSATDGLIEGKSTNTVIQRENELKEYKASLESQGFADPLILNKAYWNIDYMVQRRPDYCISVKMMSQRSRGLERGIEKRSNYYLGDGALFVRTNPDDYNNLPYYYNWHAIPGTTAEQRDDEIPGDARSAYSGANGTNTFAGVASNGKIGVAAFKYERNHDDVAAQYSTVNANKGYFFFDDEMVALGNNVQRVRQGDNAEIWTTLNQLEQRSDILFGFDNKNDQTVTLTGDGVEKEVTCNQVFWLFHDKVGYVIFPKENQAVNIQIDAAFRKPRFTNKISSEKKMFQLVINHGNNPEIANYQYFILPATTAEKVKIFAHSANKGAELNILENNAEVMACYHPVLNVVQASFFKAAELEFMNSSKEKVRISVDKPAVLMMKDTEGLLEITVTDPLHSTVDPDIKVTVNILVDDVLFDENTGNSSLIFTHSSEEVYAGKPVIQTFRKSGNYTSTTTIKKKK